VLRSACSLRAGEAPAQCQICQASAALQTFLQVAG